jgi:hypothetical protein
VHLPRKKEPNPEEKLDSVRPALSQRSNPYPAGLKPVIVEYGPPGTNCGIQPLDGAEKPRPCRDLVVTDQYLYEQPLEGMPRLRLGFARQGPRQTDEQYAAYRRDIEQFTCTHSIYLGLCQQLCTFLGNHRTCAEGPCRRTGVCSGIRDQDRYNIPLVLFPPCVPLDLEIIWTYRDEIVAEIKRVVARGE